MLLTIWRKFFPRKFKVEILAFDKEGVRKTYTHTLTSIEGWTDREVMTEFRILLENQLGYQVIYITKL